jgi:hypothetical protein
MNDKPTAMFQNACSYSKAAGVLNELALGRQSSQRTRDLAVPSAVNAALALELFLKTLYFLERGEDFKIKGRHSHDFHALYCELEVQRRQKMEEFFAQRLSKRSMSDVGQMERVSSMPVPRDLVANLKTWKDVFVDCRYIHEPPGKAISMFFFPEIEDSISGAILALRPEFAPLYLSRLA